MRYFDSFAGIGGFSLGIKQAYENYNKQISTIQQNKKRRNRKTDKRQVLLRDRQLSPLCIGYSEIDRYAIQVYEKHFNHKNYGDISKIQWDKVPDFDLFVGGSPCQDFSIAGQRSGIKGNRSGLIWEYIRALQEKKPKYFIWENVKGVMSSRNGFDFASILTAFSESGYSLQWEVLNSKNFGVPQNRERVFVVGHLGKGSGRKVFPIGESNETHLKEITQEVSDAQRIYDANGLAKSQKALGGGLGAKTGLYAIPVLTPDRPNKRQMGKRMKENGEPNFTLTGQDQHGIYNGSRIRRLTPTECMRLQGFPDYWCDVGKDGKEISDSQKYKMAGNAVSVPVVKAIVERLLF